MSQDHAENRTVVVETVDADATRALGARLAALLRAGDLVMLSGALGAGKTTLAQGIGSAMDVRGRVSSPTFIIARVHPALGQGPDLVHVDAYRLSSLEEVDALDLDTSLDESVTLVEWGEDKVEALSDNRLEIRVDRPHGALAGSSGRAPEAGPADLEEVDDGRRSVTVTAIGPRWAGTDLTVLA
ncbi:MULTISPECIES: tRNA (adenosine(37)-N6)-threonylcarbamoyltransferase complex ATPase subunit type 1 TsaE [unclassified Actinomyces]|uniref:tRNA (adenosine(37)-N6)-threonylcarbamoyltransferase complex ATPase subunit type 1 TsaE n=1 Tax=unclassified Actinomyces TaxID=2609248 RepID=UPI002017DBD6|nr:MULTISPECIES: tRNA (adenosine(37)-N6)-threonylcarbamoyltransferase complex ATPase subunit type 1 TsaE [unclassified Actinomyces]MCL3778664.1 tRNA (adenosine(37)-N6)-threonylcarbamoyltransferase complex ATPase subunit type 1 TsaE [Actinomyces sp. AC-20-1]MCL3790131.1 tRNA (adenosine(37)-N6)-threonylcarbamoyltransferase complex ATPase subunit type 1 TsaE [Actinomyces sp. 187325]MCL3791227.1 tRNA (adenosine(37)-N6)-threonylcarbamoyltransferase complex ATPase subunit type 1 TsaE [Actinomyces sp. 